MNHRILIVVERVVWCNGHTGRRFVQEAIDPVIIDTARDPGGFLLGVVKRLQKDLDRSVAEILAADKKAREEGRL